MQERERERNDGRMERAEDKRRKFGLGCGLSVYSCSGCFVFLEADDHREVTEHAEPDVNARSSV